MQAQASDQMFINEPDKIEVGTVLFTSIIGLPMIVTEIDGSEITLDWIPFEYLGNTTH